MKNRNCSSCGSPKYFCKGLCKSCYRKGHKNLVWSKNFSSCVDCGKTDHPHVARGQCSVCYGKCLSTQLCQCGCGNYTTLRGNNVKNFLHGHWLKEVGNSDAIRPNMGGEHNPQYGKFGTDHPSYGHDTSDKTREDRRKRRLDFISIKGKTTKIEFILSDLLDTLGITHQSQTTLYGKFSVDEFLPEYNLVIEAYGGYWHSDVRKFSIPSAQQRKTLSKDRSKESYLNKCGHRVLILWETELMSNHDWCIAEIILAISKHLLPFTQDSVNGKS